MESNLNQNDYGTKNRQKNLGACFKNRVAPVFAKKAGWLGATSRAYPLRSVRDVATTPDGLFRENPRNHLFSAYSISSWNSLKETGALVVLKQALTGLSKYPTFPTVLLWWVQL